MKIRIIIALFAIITLTNSLRYASYDAYRESNSDFGWGDIPMANDYLSLRIDFPTIHLEHHSSTIQLKDAKINMTELYDGAFIEVIEYKEVGTMNGYTPSLLLFTINLQLDDIILNAIQFSSCNWSPIHGLQEGNILSATQSLCQGTNLTFTTYYDIGGSVPITYGGADPNSISWFVSILRL